MDRSQKNAFMLLLGLSQAFAVAMVVLTVIWTKKVLDGFAWDGSAKQFNLHPLCMVCGFIFLYGEAILTFRVFRDHDKRLVKYLHGGFHLLAFVAMVIGLVAVFEFHNSKGIANMYSLHSWCGLVSVLLFCIQYAFGLITFLFPVFQEPIKKMYLPIHKYFGLAILFLCALTAISGINEKMFFVYPKGAYQYLPYGAYVGNFLGLIIVGFILLVGYLASNPDWKRKSDDETEPLSVHFQQVSTRTDTDDE